MGQDLTKVVTRWKLNQAHKSLLSAFHIQEFILFLPAFSWPFPLVPNGDIVQSLV
jgi:hypothetical protein